MFRIQLSLLGWVVLGSAPAFAGYLPAAGPGGQVVCKKVDAESNAAQIVTVCSNGARSTQFTATGTLIEDQVDSEGNVLRSGAMKQDVAGNVNKDFNWRKNDAYLNDDGTCKTGKMIDGKFACAGANTAIKSAELSNIGSQMIGAGALNQYGQQVWQDVAASGGDVATSYEAQAKLMDRAGDTQKKMGGVSLAAGMGQMLAYQRAQANVKELKRELAMVEKRIQVNLDNRVVGDGTNSNEYGYISGNRGDSRGAIKDQITGKVIENFNLNQAVRVNGIERPSDSELNLLKSAGILDANFRYATAYNTIDKRVTAIQNHPSMNAEQKRQALSAVRRMQLADAEMNKKKAEVVAQTKQILQRAISEQTEIAGRTAAGAATSIAQGASQIHMGNEQQRTANSIKGLADKIRENGKAAPPIVLGNTQVDTTQTGGGRGGSGLGGGGPDISLVDGVPTPGASPLGGFNGMGDPLNTKDNLETQVGPPAGAFMAGGMGGGAMGGMGGGMGGGMQPGTASLPTDSKALAGLGDKNADPYKVYGKGSDYKNGVAPGAPGAAGGAPGMEALLEAMKDNKEITRDGAPETGDRAPASGEVQFLSPDTDIFKQVSIAYRSKLESGAVGVVVQP
ncbi:MAG: hypothetical protein JNL01_10170 [Bdellovibrionales bacterium]|nr:hypothetical protein [Bdellovibrionales bacterium]